MMVSKPADVFHAIADENRRRLLDLLRDGERSVQDLVAEMTVTVGAVSQHLKVLLESGLVTRRKEGRRRIYAVRAGALSEVHAWTNEYRRFWDDSFDRLDRYLEES